MGTWRHTMTGATGADDHVGPFPGLSETGRRSSDGHPGLKAHIPTMWLFGGHLSFGKTVGATIATVRFEGRFRKVRVPY